MASKKYRKNKKKLSSGNWFRKKTLSRKILILLAIIFFACIGVYYLVFASAASYEVKVEAETLSFNQTTTNLLQDSEASGGTALQLNGNNTLSGSINLSSPTDTVTIRAKETKCKGDAALVFSVDGITANKASVTSTIWTDVVLAKPLSSGTHNFSVSFSNFYSNNRCKRTLSIDVVKFIGQPPAPTSTSTQRPLINTPHIFPLTVSGSTLNLDYWSNADIKITDNSISKLVIVIHGDSRNPDNYADYAVESAISAGAHPESSTLILAPHFKADSDITANDNNQIYWSESGWKQGNSSQISPYARPWRMSSFEVLDRLIVQAKQSSPSIKSVVIIGHSAGGQFVNRYAATTAVASDPALSGVSFRFIAANPSSYLYFNSMRWHGSTFSPLTSQELGSCSNADTYKYGLNGLNSYASIAGSAQIPQRYASRKVFLLLGDKDTDPNDTALDVSCAAEWQGAYRYQRGNIYFDFLKAYYGSIPSLHSKVIVPGVAHNGHDMINSSQGQLVIFGP